MEDNIIIDKKLKCCSIMKNIKIKDYLLLVEGAYANRGGIQGQREPLKQKTAITIRKRMIDDIVAGTILPPIVIGVIVDEATYEKSQKCEDAIQMIKSVEASTISIIDGMQRTTAIIEAVEKNIEVKENYVRVEMWVSCDVNSMLYRMLVLNTGQVPWNMRRQIELIFDGVITDVKNEIKGIEIKSISDNQRRSHGGQYNANDLVEMFFAFGARTWKIDMRERVTDEFTRGDFVQSSSETDIVKLFCRVLASMYKLDLELDLKVKDNAVDGKFKKGRDLFSSQPAKVGFSAACGELVLGRPGENRKHEIIEEKIKNIEETISVVVDKLSEEQNAIDFVDFETLSEMVNVKSSKVGDYEREKFYSAFKVFFETKGEMDALTVCWRA